MTEPSEDRPGLWMEVRLAAMLVAYAGQLPVYEVRRLARSIGIEGPKGRKANGSNIGSRTGVSIHSAVKKLRAEELDVRREGDLFVIDELLDLADYVVHRLEESKRLDGEM